MLPPPHIHGQPPWSHHRVHTHTTLHAHYTCTHTPHTTCTAYTTVSTAQVSCTQNFRGLVHYPFDNHVVTLNLESYGFSAEDVLLHPWDGGSVVAMENGKAVRKKLNGVTSGTFDIWVFELISEVKKSLNYEKDCFLYGKMYISRKELMPFMEIVFPLMLTVFLALSSLFYRLESLDIRSNLAVVGLFTTMMYLYVVKSDLPPISFLTWTHYYMVVCLVFCGIVMGVITICHMLDPAGEAAQHQVAEVSFFNSLFTVKDERKGYGNHRERGIRRHESICE